MRIITLKEVKWHPKTNRIAQIPKEGLEFAMLSPNYEQINQLVWCKDFMQDLIWSYLNNKEIDIYGFKYNPKNSPAPSLSKIRLLVTNFKDHDFGEKLQSNVMPLLHEVEDRLKMPRTVLEKCQTTPPIYKKSGVWILNGSKRWLKATPMISFYTLLIRIGLVHNPANSLEQTLALIKDGKLASYYDHQNRDKIMVYDAYQGIERIMRLSDRKIFPANIRKNYPVTYGAYSSELTIYNLHDRCGIVGFSKGSTENYFPNWHK